MATKAAAPGAGGRARRRRRRRALPPRPRARGAARARHRDREHRRRLRFYGVHVSPDVDIVTYTLGRSRRPPRGYGLEGDTHDAARDARRASATRPGSGSATATSRTASTARCACAQGAGLAAIADELRRAQGVATRILPMSEDPCPTLVCCAAGAASTSRSIWRATARPTTSWPSISRRRAARGARRRACSTRSRAPTRSCFCPSNPIVSIGPILALRGVREALRAARAPVVAISPIVGGAPVKGPADRLLRGPGIEVSARGVAGLYRDCAQGFVLDARDARSRPTSRRSACARAPSTP